MAASSSRSCSVVSSQYDLAPPEPLLECACGEDTVSFVCKKGTNSGKRFRRCRHQAIPLQYCFTWIWDEQLSKYVDEMVIHKTAAEIRGLREALEASINQVHLKEDQIRARDVQLELANNEIVTLKTKLGETEQKRLDSSSCCCITRLMGTQATHGMHKDSFLSAIVQHRANGWTRTLSTLMGNKEGKDKQIDITIVEDSEAEEDGNTQPQLSGPKKQSATSRSSTKRIAGVVSKWKNTQKGKLLHDIAFQGVMDLPQINKLDPEFTFWLLRRVDPAKRVIWIDDMTPVPIRDVDYQRVLGLPCGKRLVSGLGSKDPEDKIDFINLYIGTGGVKELYCSLKAAEFNIEKQHQGPMDKGQCDNFKVSFVVWLVCRWLAPIRRPNNGSETFWGALLKPDEISCYNWCAFALEALFDVVRKFQNNITSKRKIENLALCPIFLQIFFIDYVKNGGVNQPGKFPRIADYDYHSISFMIQELNEKMQREANLKKKQIGNETYSLDSFQKAVGASKLATKKKLALRWYGASLQRHILLLRNSIFRDAERLVEKLEVEDVTDDEGSGGTGIKRSNDGYISGSESGIEGSAGARKRNKASAWKYEGVPSFSLGFSDDEDEPTPILANCPTPSAIFASNTGIEEMTLPHTVQGQTTIDCLSVQTENLVVIGNIHSPCVQESPVPANVPRQDFSTIPVSLHLNTEGILDQTNDKAPINIACSSTQAPSQHHIKPMENADMGINFVTPLPKGQTSKCISPATVTKCFSETKVVNRMDPWDNKINLNCKSLEFEFTDSPINKKKIAGGGLSKSPWSQGLSHPKRDVMLIRKFSTWLAASVHDDLDREWIMHAVPRYVEVSGTDLKNMLCGRATMSYSLFDVAIRWLNQLDRLMHALKHLIHWRHILESDFAMLVFAGEEVTANSSVRKQFIGEEVLHQIESCRMITIPALVSVDSGVLTLIAVRDFNGTYFSSLNGQDFITCFKEQLLHELLSIRGNNAKTPSNFVESIDLE